MIRPQSVEEQYTTTGELYLRVHGFDMDGTATGAIRLWRYSANDIIAGQIYVIRGLKVVEETYWSAEAWKYVPNEDGTKTIEITYRTAVEDVTDVVEIAKYFL